jgi:hypothetical protein
MIFKTPQDAIAASDAECVRVWKEFAKNNSINDKISPDLYPIFRHGYMAGASFISSLVIKHKSAIQQPKDP